EAQVHLVNQPRHSSLRPPGALFSLFRGLQAAGTATVPARVLGEAIDGLGLSADETNLLVLDMPGTTHALVTSLDPARLSAFAFVLVRGSEEPLYDGDVPIDETVTALRAAGYEPVDLQDDEVFPFRTALLRRPPGFQAAIRAGARIAELEAGLKAEADG